MGFFSGGRSIRSRLELEKLLRTVGILDADDRRLIENMLSKKLSGGISKREIILATRELMNDPNERVNRTEALAVRRRLLNYLRYLE